MKKKNNRNIGSFRKDGSDTMLAGAIAVGPKVATIRQRVLDLIEEHGDLTDYWLHSRYTKLFGPIEYRSLGARRRELVIDGLVVDTGHRVKNLDTGVNNILWGLVKADKKAAA